MRKGTFQRETKETAISVEISVDGTGRCASDTGVGFLDHMLELFAKHGIFDLSVKAKGDTHVDYHHTVEDIGICLGKAISQAIGDKSGIRRFGFFILPMFEAQVTVSLDICGRSHLNFDVPDMTGKIGDFDCELVEEFFNGLVDNAGITMHISLQYGSNKHHIVEAIFKCFAKALDIATSIDERVAGVPSTKGIL